MTNGKPLNDKILLLGLDGMDPRLTRKYVDAGLMPNTAEFIRRGSARKDLVMLNGDAANVDDAGLRLLRKCAWYHGLLPTGRRY